MIIKIYFQKKNVYDIEVPDNFNELHMDDRDTYVYVFSKEMLENFYSRLPLTVNLTLFYYQVLDYNLKYYERQEEYEICHILYQMKLVVLDSTKREKFKQNEK